MNKDQYQVMQDLLFATSSALATQPWERFIQAIDQADTVGPLIDPTQWRSLAAKGARDNMLVIRKMAECVQELVRLREKLQRRVLDQVSKT